MSKIKIMTTEEYSKSGLKKTKYGNNYCSQQMIRKAISTNKLHLLPNVLSIIKSGKYHLLEVKVS